MALKTREKYSVPFRFSIVIKQDAEAKKYERRKSRSWWIEKLWINIEKANTVVTYEELTQFCSRRNEIDFFHIASCDLLHSAMRFNFQKLRCEAECNSIFNSNKGKWAEEASLENHFESFSEGLRESLQNKFSNSTTKRPKMRNDRVIFLCFIKFLGIYFGWHFIIADALDSIK